MADSLTHDAVAGARGRGARLALVGELASRVAPVVLAEERRLEVAGPLTEVLPGGGLRRGSVVTVGGVPGAGPTQAALHLAAAATAAGEWVAFVDPGSLGGVAAQEAGVELERCAVVRAVPSERWAVVVGALLDGVSMVLATAPPRLALGDARRLASRVRERQGVLVIVESAPGPHRVGTWPAEAAVRIAVDAARWSGLGAGDGVLGVREWSVCVEGKGVARRSVGLASRAG